MNKTYSFKDDTREHILSRSYSLFDPGRDQVICLSEYIQSSHFNQLVESIPDLIRQSGGLSLSQAMAYTRDAGMLAASLQTIKKNINNKVIDLLIATSEITSEVPRDTVYSYGIRQNPSQLITFTNLDEEKLFIDGVNKSISSLYEAIGYFYQVKEIIVGDIECIPKETLFNLMNKAEESFNGMLSSMIRIRNGISPEVFTYQLRPFFDPLIIGDMCYDAPGGAQMPMFIFEQFLYKLNSDSQIQEFLTKNLLYCPLGLRRLSIDLSNTEPMIDMIEKISPGDHRDSLLFCIQRIVAKIYQFRAVHYGVAQKNFQLRSSSEKGSGGYNPDILKHLLDATKSQKNKLAKLLSK